MSFSGEVKKELAALVPEARHCQIAELAALKAFQNDRNRRRGHAEKGGFYFRTDRADVASLLFTLFQRAFNMDVNVVREENGGRTERVICEVVSADPEYSAKAEKALSHSSILRLECCRRAYLRGAFLAAGSVSDPEKSYHLEFACGNAEIAEKLQALLRQEGFDARIVLRKKEYVVYLKESDQITDLLGMMGASISFLNIENVRVVKQMRGSVNRKVNFETANLDRTVESAVRQIEDIRFIQNKRGFEDLSPALREMAELRLQNPEASLGELGKMLSPPIGKSGVNHRLRKLSAYAEKLRSEEN